MPITGMRRSGYYSRRLKRAVRGPPLAMSRPMSNRHTRFIRNTIIANQKVHFFKRKLATAWSINVTAAAASSNGSNFGYFSSQVKLSDLTNVADFTGLFDLYRINAVKLKFLHGYNCGVANETGVGASGDPNLMIGVPTLHIVSDPDDSTTPTGTAEILERPYSKSLYLDKDRKFYLKPRVAREVSDGTVTYNYVQYKDRPYIDMNHTDVAYNGIKVALEVPFRNVTASSQTINIYLPIVATYYLEMKNPR